MFNTFQRSVYPQMVTEIPVHMYCDDNGMLNLPRLQKLLGLLNHLPDSELELTYQKSSAAMVVSVKLLSCDSVEYFLRGPMGVEMRALLGPQLGNGVAQVDAKRDYRSPAGFQSLIFSLYNTTPHFLRYFVCRAHQYLQQTCHLSLVLKPAVHGDVNAQVRLQVRGGYSMGQEMTLLKIAKLCGLRKESQEYCILTAHDVLAFLKPMLAAP